MMHVRMLCHCHLFVQPTAYKQYIDALQITSGILAYGTLGTVDASDSYEYLTQGSSYGLPNR